MSIFILVLFLTRLKARHNDRIKRLSSFRTHLKKHDLDPKEVDLDSCVVVLKRESPEPEVAEVPEVPDFLQVPAIHTHRSPKISSRSSSRFSSPLSTLSSPLSSLSDVSDIASPYEEPHKDFRESWSYLP